ncbi:WecB/TagA/CpsF family glycosyltransferase [Enterococcus faecium]|uniref:WecB/TagA/CpsF family glycosyltransferase n=1 Tax=Enterococcus faecium TaxID=1352 RepID=UPI001BD1556F|nr:WecB/TagA/CpsF family glycosyltransferase [Enterococcus faecium]
MTTEYICGLPVDNLTEETICQDLPVYITSGRKMLVTSVNPQISLQVERYPQVKAYIERATHRLPDGVGVVKMSKYLGGAICKRVTGIDVMDMMLQYADEQGHRIFLYGAKKEIVKKAAENIAKDYPNLVVAGYLHGFTSREPKKVVEKINAANPTFLFVALGSPKQELFLEQQVDKLNASVFLDVGGTFDVLSGEVSRAPELFIKLNLEWLYRSVRYGRWERLKQIPLFVIKSWQMRRQSKKKTEEAASKTPTPNNGVQQLHKE